MSAAGTPKFMLLDVCEPFRRVALIALDAFPWPQRSDGEPTRPAVASEADIRRIVRAEIAALPILFEVPNALPEEGGES